MEIHSVSVFFLRKNNPYIYFPGFKPVKHMVFSGLYPADGTNMSELEHAIEKLTCNDSSVSVEIQSSAALGRGFRSHCSVFLDKFWFKLMPLQDIYLTLASCLLLHYALQVQVWFSRSTSYGCFSSATCTGMRSHPKAEIGKIDDCFTLFYLSVKMTSSLVLDTINLERAILFYVHCIK